LLDEFRPDLVSQSPNLAFADLDVRHSDGIGGIAKRGEASSGGDDSFEDRGTVSVLIESQSRPQGGKSPVGNRDSERCVRPVGRWPPER
jgi:hypothetical protein